MRGAYCLSFVEQKDHKKSNLEVAHFLACKELYNVESRVFWEQKLTKHDIFKTLFFICYRQVTVCCEIIINC